MVAKSATISPPDTPIVALAGSATYIHVGLAVEKSSVMIVADAFPTLIANTAIATVNPSIQILLRLMVQTFLKKRETDCNL